MSSSSQPSLAQIAQRIFDDALQNIIHDITITQHRQHKMLLQSLDPQTKLPQCSTCKLPRLIDPPLAPKVRGAASDPSPKTEYCDRKPWSRRPGHDIYDNPFPKADVSGRPPTKKEREAAAKNKNIDGTPENGSQAGENGTAPGSPSADNDAGNGGGKLEKGEKKASKIDEKLKKGEYVPWHTCPSCKRSLLITRFAKHLEACMGISGRAASRNAMAKMNGTPSGSRGGTPNPSQENGDRGEDDDDEDKVKAPGLKKKLLKKGLNNKLKKEKGFANGKLPKNLTSKNSLANGRASPAPSSLGADAKRDRDEMLLGEDGDEDEVHVKKRQKLQRVGSTASVTSSIAPNAPIEMKRGESQDGSFVDDGEFVDDGSIAED